MTSWYFEKHDKYSKIGDAAEGNGWKVVPLCVEVGARGYINDKWHHMTRALKLDKRMNKRLRDAVSDVAVRCSYFLYVCLRDVSGALQNCWVENRRIINGKLLQPANLIANRKQRPAGAGRVHGGESMRFLVCVMEGIRSP